MAGQAAYEAGTIDTIQRMIRRGELPGKNVCVLSGTPTGNTVVFRIQCERVWTRGSRLDRTDKMLLGFLLFGWIGAIVGWTRKDKPRREFGRETYVDVPLRVCPGCQERVNGGRQAALKRALRKIPIYDTLLTEYPEAWVLPGTTVQPGSR
jgi:hypothetical protein